YAKQQGFGIVKAGSAYKLEKGKTLNERRNFDKERRLKMMEGDANAMAAYFHRMSTDNQNFFHLHRLDDDERLKDLMWVDARSRAGYIEFGDVVCFDSTYLTNRDVEWVFTNWISYMGGKPPSGILTDQDAAIKKAIAKVMPNTRHRWCLWHILNKLPLKLGGYDKYEEIKQPLLRAIYDSYTVEEFENSWNEAIDAYNLGENTWLKVDNDTFIKTALNIYGKCIFCISLYQEREWWIPPYMKDMFWAGMRSTQRVESMNSFFDKYLKKQTRLYEFVQQYCKAMERRAEDEKQADARLS
ncbi:Protein FAR-RED IMPAIRED RESPONSE 1, partial [Bienertia sinuspersici]